MQVTYENLTFESHGPRGVRLMRDVDPITTEIIAKLPWSTIRAIAAMDPTTQPKESKS